MSPYFYSLGVLVNDSMIDRGHAIIDRMMLCMELATEENQ